jgi:hypothetical protein
MVTFSFGLSLLVLRSAPRPIDRGLIAERCEELFDAAVELGALLVARCGVQVSLPPLLRHAIAQGAETCRHDASIGLRAVSNRGNDNAPSAQPLQ